MPWRKLSIQALIIVLTILVTAWVVQGLPLVAHAAAQQVTSTDGLDLSPEEQNNVRIYQEADRAVVNITTRGAQQDDIFMTAVPREGSGSGFVLDKQGHIVTNFHVIDDARQIVVNLYDGSSYPGELIGVDPNNELAVLRIKSPESKLFPIRWGDSSKLMVGMRVYALGNPFGLERTLTLGIVSSLNRMLKTDKSRTIRGVIQTDAAINPGNSGGPLLNRKGEIIGINTAIVTRSGQSAGIGLAIPSNNAQKIVNDLIKFGKIQRADLGINAVFETDKGLLIAQLNPKGAAALAGLKGPQEWVERRNGLTFRGINRLKADLIQTVDGKKVKTLDDMLTLVETRKAGDTVVLGVLRDGEKIEVPVELEWSK
ncbi:MAG TPA: trypsin-like peptidase domain-containing protein [Gemmatales bacterium]|nr:trypsin-like peptidase domain-containing protein [Gemmatales bacterium]